MEGGGRAVGGGGEEEGGEGGVGEGLVLGEEPSAELVDGALDALGGGGDGEVEAGGDVGEVVVLKVAEDEEFAVGGGEGGDGVVEKGEEVGDGGGFGGNRGRLHGGLAFVALAAAVGAAGVLGTEAGRLKEPAGEGGAIAKSVGFLNEEEEDGLGDVVGVVGALAGGGGVDEVDVARDEGGEGGGVAAEVGVEEVGVGHARSFVLYLSGEGRRGHWGSECALYRGLADGGVGLGGGFDEEAADGAGFFGPGEGGLLGDVFEDGVAVVGEGGGFGVVGAGGVAAVAEEGWDAGGFDDDLLVDPIGEIAGECAGGAGAAGGECGVFVEGVAAVDIDAGEGEAEGTGGGVGVGDIGIGGEFPFAAEDDDFSRDIAELEGGGELEIVLEDFLQSGAELVGGGEGALAVGEIAAVDGALGEVAFDFQGFEAEDLLGEHGQSVAACAEEAVAARIVSDPANEEGGAGGLGGAEVFADEGVADFGRGVGDVFVEFARGEGVVLGEGVAGGWGWRGGFDEEMADGAEFFGPGEAGLFGEVVEDGGGVVSGFAGGGVIVGPGFGFELAPADEAGEVGGLDEDAGNRACRLYEWRGRRGR